MKFALIIAVDDFLDSHSLASRPFSVDGANKISDAIALHGFDKSNQTLLLQSKATKAIIESRLRNIVAKLSPEDSIYLFIDGYSFNQHGENLWSCFDTQASDLVATTISITKLVDQVRQTNCELALILNGSDLSKETRDTEVDSNAVEQINPFDVEQIEQSFANATGQICFGTSAAGEKSLDSNLLRGNIWASLLEQALIGQSDAIAQDNQVTGGSLAKYLKKSTGIALKQAFSKKQSQTPWMAGDAKLILADLSDVVAEQNSKRPLLNNAGQVSLVRQREINIRNLLGFQKTHSVPTATDDRSIAFVGKLAKQDLEQDLDAIYAELKKAFRFKRREIQVDSTDDGFGTIQTPHFEYTVAITQSATDPSSATLSGEVTNVQELDQILSESFSDVFAAVFDTLEFSPQHQLDIESLIDRIEQLDDHRIRLQYERDATWCNLIIDGIDATFRFTNQTMEIIKRQPTSPHILIELFMEVQNRLVDENSKPLIAFD